MNLTDKSQLISYLKSHSLYAKKGLGQNFLIDKDALAKIIEAAELGPDDFVIEIGPGLGVLTQELVKKAGQVVAVELDEKLAEMLASSFQTVISNDSEKSHEISRLDKSMARNDKPEIINADILELSISEIVAEKKYKVVANIPYYITSKILQFFLTLKNKPESIVLLVQKEVAERITAKPGEMSILALSVQAYGEPEIVDDVPKESFFPAPKVDSAILRIKNVHAFGCHFERSEKSHEISRLEKSMARNDDSCRKSEKDFFRIIHIGFASKRKTLLNNFSAGLRIDKALANSIITSSNINPNARAQDLGLDDWVQLTKAFSKY